MMKRMLTSVSQILEADFDIRFTKKKRKINNKTDVDFRNTFFEADVDIRNSHKSKFQCLNK